MLDAPCQLRSADRGEPLFATASSIRSWLLLEQPGAWGSEALLESGLDPAVGRRILDLGATLGVAARFRAVLVRHLGTRRVESCDGYLAYSGRDGSWLRRLPLPDPAGVLDLDLSPLTAGRPVPFGEEIAGPFYLVCTNGKHDPCCAQFGRPVFRDLQAMRPGRTWECSHIGGDRFAGNLVVLPLGLYFGRLGAGDGPRVVAALEQGSIDLDHYRGRSCDPLPVQAGEYFLRREMGLVGIDDVAPRRWERGEGGQRRITFAAPGGARYVVTLAVTRQGAHRLTCTAQEASHPPVFSLLGVERLR